MPNSTTIILIRHAEKPESGIALAVAGQERAHAYAVYFQNYALNSSPIKFNYLFAAADSEESHRPRLTIEPLAQAIGLGIDNKHKDKDYQKVAADILQNSKYNNSNILICWHHGKILELAETLGVDPSKLPKESQWPSPPWPNEVFGWLLQVCYDESGTIIPSQTLCINEQLMYNDYGKNPPAFNEDGACFSS